MANFQSKLSKNCKFFIDLKKFKISPAKFSVQTFADYLFNQKSVQELVENRSKSKISKFFQGWFVNKFLITTLNFNLFYTRNSVNLDS